MSLWITGVVACVLVVGWLLWRTGPIILGAARASDGRNARVVKWNRYIVPTLRKLMDQRLLAAKAQIFKSDADGREYSIATWAMVPTVLPDVDYVALARPGGDEETPEVMAVAEAPTLRALLGDAVQSQSTWGHQTWVCTWPDGIDLEAVTAELVPAAKFRAMHGASVSAQDVVAESGE